MQIISCLLQMGREELWREKFRRKQLKEEQEEIVRQSVFQLAREGYPPMVPRSKDGEEGFVHPRCISSQQSQGFTPAPNRTVTADSPPMQAVGLLHHTHTSQQWGPHIAQGLAVPGKTVKSRPKPNQQCSGARSHQPNTTKDSLVHSNPES